MRRCDNVSEVTLIRHKYKLNNFFLILIIKTLIPNLLSETRKFKLKLLSWYEVEIRKDKLQ